MMAACGILVARAPRTAQASLFLAPPATSSVTSLGCLADVQDPSLLLVPILSQLPRGLVFHTRAGRYQLHQFTCAPYTVIRAQVAILRSSKPVAIWLRARAGTRTRTLS
jgi:hypothetical protein